MKSWGPQRFLAIVPNGPSMWSCQLWKPPFEASAKFPKSPIWPLLPPQAVPHFVISFSVTIRFPRCFLNSLPSLPFPDPETLFCPDILRDSAGICNPGTRGAETGGWQVPGPPGLHSKETLWCFVLTQPITSEESLNGGLSASGGLSVEDYLVSPRDV